MIMMKVLVSMLFGFVSSAWALEIVITDLKYRVGDCITPTNPNYTWFGKVAKVRMVGITDDARSTNGYALEFVKDSFENGMSNYGIFAGFIDNNTTAVAKQRCR
jgi:hypothetical protein